MEKFTKGEWAVDYIGDVVWITSGYDNFNKGLAKVTFYGVNERDTMEANANLIVSAPKMYSLLKKIMIEHCNDSVLYNEIDELLEKARGE